MTDVTHTYETTWLGQPALALETASLRVVTVPGMGAKIVSLFDKERNREWLLPPINRDFKPADYASSFVDQDMSGWDEIFPTTDACDYPVDGSYKGNLLPDHGEVWALPWKIDRMTNDSVTLSTTGRALPYRMSRTMEALAAKKVRFTFEVVNTGSEPFVALWSAHPQFAVDAETRITLPETVEWMVNVHRTPDWGEIDQTYPWAKALSQKGQWHRLDRIASADLHNCRKFFALPDQPIPWAALQQGDDGAWVRLSWDAAQVPYFGLWVDEGTYNSAPTAALEPTTGYYDRLDRAWQNDRVMQVQPDQPVRWFLDVEVGNGTLV